MIELNGVKFAASKSQALDTLFSGPVTASGWYRLVGHSIKLYNLRGEEIGGVNRHGVLYSTDRLPNGRKWYSYADPDGIPPYQSIRQRNEECAKVRELIPF